MRLVLKPTPEGMSRADSFAYFQSHEPAELFDVKEAVIELPEPARIFKSEKCSCCGEITAEPMLRLQGGKLFCLDCYDKYNRFEV